MPVFTTTFARDYARKSYVQNNTEPLNSITQLCNVIVEIQCSLTHTEVSGNIKKKKYVLLNKKHCSNKTHFLINMHPAAWI